MKIRDISLIGTGAIIAAALIALTFTLASPPKAQAQAAAAAPGANAITVTVPPASGPQSGAGMITINDSVGKKVTVVTYSFTANGGPGPTVLLSTPATFNY